MSNTHTIFYEPPFFVSSFIEKLEDQQVPTGEIIGNIFNTIANTPKFVPKPYRRVAAPQIKEKKEAIKSSKNNNLQSKKNEKKNLTGTSLKTTQSSQSSTIQNNFPNLQSSSSTIQNTYNELIMMPVDDETQILKKPCLEETLHTAKYMDFINESIIYFISSVMDVYKSSSLYIFQYFLFSLHVSLFSFLFSYSTSSSSILLLLVLLLVLLLLHLLLLSFYISLSCLFLIHFHISF